MKQDFLFHIDTTLMVEVMLFRIQRASISVTGNHGKCSDLQTSKIISNDLGFWCREPKLVTYVTKISLLQSLVASQQKATISYLQVALGHPEDCADLQLTVLNQDMYTCSDNPTFMMLLLNKFLHSLKIASCGSRVKERQLQLLVWSNNEHLDNYYKEMQKLKLDKLSFN